MNFFNARVWQLLREEFGPDLICSVLVVTKQTGNTILQSTFVVAPLDTEDGIQAFPVIHAKERK